MAGIGNGRFVMGNGEARTQAAGVTPRCPRRIVLLADGVASSVVGVLFEQGATEVSGKRLQAELQRFAAQHRGHTVAAEWLGPRGWTRFVWCQK